MRIAVLHDRPDELAPLLGPLDPLWVTCGAELPAALAQAPELVFSIKHSGFPGHEHRPAIEHPSVRWFHVGGSGFEHLGRWREGVAVTNCAGVLAPFHAEMAVAALASLCVGLPGYGVDQRARRWRPRRFRAMAGRTLLVVGVGHTGGALAQRARALGLRVIGVRASGAPHPDVEAMYTPDALPGLWGRADVIALNLRLTPATQGLVDAAALAAMRPGALLLNGARGGVVDQAALVAALTSGQLGGAWLDVTDPEPLPSDSPLWAMDNVILTPHVADQVADFPLRFARRFVDNLARYRAGEPLVGVVPRP